MLVMCFETYNNFGVFFIIAKIFSDQTKMITTIITTITIITTTITTSISTMIISTFHQWECKI